MGEARQNHPTNQGGRARRRQLEQGGGVSGVAILAEAIQIEDITVIQRTRDGELSNEIRIAALTLTDVNTRNEPMQLEGALTVLGDGSTAPLDIALDGAIRVASDFSKIEIADLKTEVIGALTQPVESTLSGAFVMVPAKADFTLSARLPGGVAGQLVWSALESPEVKLDISTARLDVDQSRHRSRYLRRRLVHLIRGTTLSSTYRHRIRIERTGTAPVVPGIWIWRCVLRLRSSSPRVTDRRLVYIRVRDGVADIEYVRGVLHQGQLDTRVTLNARRPVVEAEVEGGLKGVNMDSCSPAWVTPTRHPAALSWAGT